MQQQDAEQNQHSGKNIVKHVALGNPPLYHAPQKHYLPEKIPPELFLKLPLPDLSFSEWILKITWYPLYLCELHDITRLRPLSLSNYFYYHYPIWKIPN